MPADHTLFFANFRRPILFLLLCKLSIKKYFEVEAMELEMRHEGYRYLWTELISRYQRNFLALKPICNEARSLMRPYY